MGSTNPSSILFIPFPYPGYEVAWCEWNVNIGCRAAPIWNCLFSVMSPRPFEINDFIFRFDAVDDAILVG